jgi:hypothetical protein
MADLSYASSISLGSIYDNSRIIIIVETLRLLIEDIDSIYLRL